MNDQVADAITPDSPPGPDAPDSSPEGGAPPPSPEPAPEPSDEFKKRFDEIDAQRKDYRTKHQRLMEDHQNLREAYAAAQARLTDKKPSDPKPMTREEFLASLEKDPLSVFDQREKSLKESIIKEAKEQILSEIITASQKHTTQAGMQKFAQENEGFEDMLVSGELDKFIRQNAGHNHYSAYFALTGPKRMEEEKARIEKEVRDAIEKEKAEPTGDPPPKKKVIPGGKGVKPGDMDGKQILKNPNEFGGINKALGLRVEQRRAKTR